MYDGERLAAGSFAAYGGMGVGLTEAEWRLPVTHYYICRPLSGHKCLFYANRFVYCGIMYNFAKYEEGTGQMAYGYSQIYGNGNFIVVRI